MNRRKAAVGWIGAFAVSGGMWAGIWWITHRLIG